MINKKQSLKNDGRCAIDREFCEEVVAFTKSDERLMQLLCIHCSIFIDNLSDKDSITTILTAGDVEVTYENPDDQKDGSAKL